MKNNIEPLQPDSFYHIYNRGINGENIFKEEKNYAYFLSKYALYVSPYVSTYAYCLLKNHFHLLVRTKSTQEIKLITNENLVINNSKVGVVKREIPINKDISWVLSNAFASFFKSYSQSLNKAHNRTGRLFEEPFRRISVNNDSYFSEIVYYIHFNPQRHGFVNDFRDYPHSSYHSHLLTASTKLKRDEVILWFGNKAEYEKFHNREFIFKNLNKYEIEFD